MALGKNLLGTQETPRRKFEAAPDLRQVDMKMYQAASKTVRNAVMKCGLLYPQLGNAGGYSTSSKIIL